MDASRTIILVSKEGDKLNTNEKAASRSKLIQNLLQDYPEEAEIPLVEVTTETLQRVIGYLEHYQNKEPKEIRREQKFENAVDEWDANFVKIDTDKLFELINAANYMDIESLLDLTAAKIASYIKGKSSEDIEQKFNPPALTSEQEDEIIKDSQWVMDNL